MAALNSMAAAAEASGGAYPGAPSVQERKTLLESGDGNVHVLLVRQGDQFPEPQPSIYMLVGGGANITAQVGSNGVLLVNSGKVEMSDKILAALKSITSEPLRTIIVTDGDPGSSGGNHAIGATGAAVTGGDVTFLSFSGAGETSIISAESVLNRMSAAGGPDARPRDQWPNNTFGEPSKPYWFNNESIRIIHQPAAHTDGDLLVHFRRSDVVSAGNIYSTTRYPFIDISRGGSIQGIIEGLNRLVYDLMIPGPQNDGGTLVIPNYGYLSGFSDVVFYQEMVIIIRDRIQNMIKKGMSLAQVQAAHPTFEFDARYGAKTGDWTTEMFVEAVYKSLRRGRE